MTANFGGQSEGVAKVCWAAVSKPTLDKFFGIEWIVITTIAKENA